MGHAVHDPENFTNDCPGRADTYSMNDQDLPLTLYFDGRCPLCLREIRWLAQRARQNRLRLVDVHDDLALTCHSTPSREDMLGMLHARTARGQWLVGVEATVAAWQAAGVGRWVSWLTWPLVRRLSVFVYRGFARYRHRLAALVGEQICDRDCREEALKNAGVDRD